MKTLIAALIVTSFAAQGYAQTPSVNLHLKDDAVQLTEQLKHSVPSEQTQTESGFSLKYSFISADSAFQLGCVEVYSGGQQTDNYCDISIDPAKSKAGSTSVSVGGYLPVLMVEFQDVNDKSLIQQIVQRAGFVQSLARVTVMARDGKKLEVNRWDLRAAASTSSGKTTFTVVP